MIRSQVLTKCEDLAEFQSQWISVGGHPVELAYLERSMVRAFFRGKEMVAGYCLNESIPLRYEMWIPPPMTELHSSIGQV